MRFAKLAVLLAVVTAARAATIPVSFTIAPGATWGGVLTVTPEDWGGSPAQPGIKFEDEIFFLEGYLGLDGSRHRSFIRVDGGGNDSGQMYFGEAGSTDFETSYWAGIPQVPAQYHLTIRNVGLTPADIVLHDDDLTPNPEPSTWMLFAGGLAVLAVVRRVRQN